MEKKGCSSAIVGFIVLFLTVYIKLGFSFDGAVYAFCGIFSILIAFLVIILEYSQMLKFYGYSLIGEKIQSGFKEGIQFFGITVFGYFIFFVAIKLIVVLWQTLFSDGYSFTNQELINYEGYKNFFKAIEEPKTHKLLHWIWQKSSTLKDKYLNPNLNISQITNFIEFLKKDIVRTDWIDDIKIYCIDFLKTQLPKLPSIINFIRVITGFNFFMYNLLLFLKIIFGIKFTSLVISRIIFRFNFMRKIQEGWELNHFESKQKEKKINRIAHFLLIGDGKDGFATIIALIWWFSCYKIYPLKGINFVIILCLHITYLYVIRLILKNKLESKVYFKNYGLIILMIFVGYCALEALILYYNDLLLLGKLPITSAILYSLLTIIVFLYVGLTATDKLHLEKIEEVLKQKDLELAKQKVQNQLIEEGLKRQQAENELITKDNILKNEQIQKQILENKLVSENLAKQELKNKLIVEKLDKKDLETSLLKSQLISLKNQIDEHFMANSLSFIGAKVIDDHPELFEAIKTLSDILRYNFETANINNEQMTTKNFMVPIEKEIDYIKKYLEFNQLRHSNQLQYTFDYDGEILFKKILKLILINYIENAIKHGDIRDPQHPMVIRLMVEDNTLFFNISNKKLNRKQNVSKRQSVGNINTKQRLELVYPNNHELTILDEENEYTVSLTINLI